jgi:cytochrome P450
MWAELAYYNNLSLADKDDDDHDRLRGIAHRYFTPRRVNALEATMQDAWDTLLAEAASQEVYDHRHTSQALALRVITDLVGCPGVDAPYVAGLIDRLARFQGARNEDVIRDAYKARLEFNDYIESVIVAGYRRDPDSNDFVRAMLDAEGEDNLSLAELIAMVAVLLFGGIETTAVLLSNGLLELLIQRRQWEWICEDPGSRVPNAIEEIFRYVSPAQFIPRTAKVDFDLKELPVAEGQTVIAAVAPANRDPDEYESPEVFDVSRGRPHLGLGIGPHFCIGASLVRAEARIALTGLASRYPKLELAIDPSELDWSGGPPSIRTVRELPIALGVR